ncbi:hypothetical protein G7085_05140 [Tessaracoccus sp. HDW20]|uniref:hypothetical protein n=1 Tax=Tessaracoccus coleopterorum TaxID=2714950 RepID=UPI0018D406B2|nr:hypothetical protein [Tessaracoccus coleopterorum]NHB84215.1 hypothetical protein [Tessaracoccus coleopterorum]
MAEFRAGQLVGLLLRYWWMLVLGVGLGLGLAAIALNYTAPTYTATATQLVKGIPGRTSGANYIAAQYAVARAKSYPALIYSTPVLEGVRGDLGEEFTDTRLRAQLHAGNPTDTPLINITAEGGTPEEAKQLADSAALHLAAFISTIETIGGESPVVVSTAVDAELPSSPSSPKPTLFYGMGAAVGLAIGLLAALAWHTVGSRVAARRARSQASPS